ncbi:YbaN family protein [Colwellia sp. D2M02]|uniref:YbaN family protein n=1 Tax=Colwellia sp. D2M02 TaxID=2841562 RepID=UPI001C09A40D|nr:YbaN family protein [Colwellia sp. D2M02]MBU2893700.1 YbaN family protein [Colwellia sp. D2M02]
MNLKVTLVSYKNIGYQLLGLALVGLGIIGIVLPVMPTTIFFILALACFTHSSPKLTAWLLNHPRYGASLRHWQAHKVVPIKAKWFAGASMLAGLIILSLSNAPWWVVSLVAAIEVIIMIYLVARPSQVPQNELQH